MRSALAPLLSRRPKALAVAPDETPVAYTRRSSVRLPLIDGMTADAQLRTYDSVPALYACVSELAEATAQVEWHLYRRQASGVDEDRVEITEAGGGHAALDLWEQPNPYMDRTFFVELCQMHMELAGEAFIVIGTDRRAPGLPISLWPVIPTMMTPVPDPKRFLAGYIYTDPDGTRVPFMPDEVIHLKYPNPRDPYRGLSPVAALMTDLDGSRFAAEYNRNFFLNSAEPGGVIEIEDAIGDDEFDELAARWAEQHQGVGNAHRVAILTNGMKWVDRSFSMRDLQFSELQTASDARIMLGFKMGKTLLGQTENVNRATAEAAEYVFGKYRVTRRLNRWRRMWNRRILPMYAGGALLEFDYESPISTNVEEEKADRDSRVSAAVAMIGAGFDPLSVVEAFELPDMALVESAGGAGGPAPRDQAEMIQKIYLGVGTVVTWEEARQVLRDAGLDLADIPPPAPAAAPAGMFGSIETTGRPAITTGIHAGRRWPVRPRNAGDPPAHLPPDQLPSVERLQTKFDEVLAGLLDGWADLEADQKSDLVDQVRHIAAHGSIADLANLSVDTGPGADLLEQAMADIGDDAADAVVQEAAAQGVTVKPRDASPTSIRDVAVVVAGLVAARLVASAASTAMRANGPTVTAADVALKVREGLDGLSVDGPRPQLAGALTGTQNEARIETLRRAPEGALYSSESNDSNTCGPCAAVNGKWLGNVSDIDQVCELYPGGAYGGYIDCEGRERCRGTIVGVWRQGIDTGDE